VHTPQRLSGILAALVAVVPVAASSALAKEPAAVNEAAVDRMIDLNRKAYTDIQDQHFQAAKYRLSEALVISETGGLENDEMTARTYVHMAAVYLTGLKDREEAIQLFMLALQINPNITITPGLESPALKSAYLQAREQLDLPPNLDATAPLFHQAASSQPPGAAPAKGDANGKPPAGDANGANSAAWNKDPDLPARVPSPLYCHLPFDTPPGQDVVVRCLTQKQPRKSAATFHYRPQGSDGEYVGLPMERSPKGWLMIVVPGRAVQGNSLSYYVKAEIPGSQSALFLGHPEAPNELIIRKPPSPGGAEDATEESEASAAPVENRSPNGEDVRPSRLRAPGSVWIALGGGMGAVYHGRETVDSDAKIPNTTTPVSVQSGFSPATLLQLEPEIGYQVSKRFSVSIMGRYQVVPKDASGKAPGTDEKAVPTAAFAGFLRGQFAFLSRGGFQTYATGGAGLGTSFLAIVSKHCPDASCSLDHDDTIHGGPVGVTAGLGAIYHVVPSFGVFLEIKEIATLPKFMALSEVNAGLAFTHKFLGSEGQKQAGSTGRVSWR
jgi:opacity protein-like surface antigen